MVLLLRFWSFICVNDIHLIIPVNMHLSTQRHCESMVISTLATYFQPSTWFIWYLHSQFSQFSCSVMSNSLHTHGLQHARLPCPSPNPGAYSNSCPFESVMPSNHLILCRPILLPPSIFPSIRIFSNESTLRMRWPKYWSFSFSFIPSKEIPGLISFRMDWLRDSKRDTDV